MIALSTRRYFWSLIWQLTHINKSLKKKYDDHPSPSLKLSKELKLVCYAISLYVVFVTWGFLQEKIISTNYDHYSFEPVKWNYPMVLNLFVTLSCALCAHTVGYYFDNERKRVPFHIYWKVAFTSALASPIGYFSLKFVSFPMLVLSKSSKHVPVMIIGSIWYNKKYDFYKYISVAMICCGIFLFTFAKGSSSSTVSSSMDNPSLTSLSIGLLLILFNLFLDGLTNNEQDQVFKDYSASPLQMMQSTNYWQSIYLGGYLLLEWIIMGQQGQIVQSLFMLTSGSHILLDIGIFCLCACIGQLLLFSLIRDFGSFVWITINVSRQFITVLLSVFMFNHPVRLAQWVGIFFVFSGLGVEIITSNASTPVVEKEVEPQTIDIENLSVLSPTNKSKNE